MPNKKRGNRKRRARSPAPKRKTRAPKPMRIVDARTPGRPTAYAAQYAHIAQVMADVGATDLEIARACGVSVRTLYRWKSEHPEFCQALKVGKDACDDRVEMSLYHRAVGYTHEATKFLQNGSEVISVQHLEHVPPDTTAAIFWLKNRRALLWRDRREVAAELVDKRLEDLTDDELVEIIRKEQEARARAEAAAAAGTPAK